MKISIYVHELLPQVGHSRAMIELINGLLPEQKKQITHIEVISFTASPLETLFPDFNCKKVLYKIPFLNLKPFIVKMFFYHLYSFWHSIVHAKDHVKIGIGIACVNVDIINIQFLHKQWEEGYFKSTKLGILKKIYKKILFKYFSVCEDYVYTEKNLKRNYIIIAKFMHKYMHETFKIPESNLHLIPSGVNLNEFKLSNMLPNELLQYLQKSYPVLSELDATKPIVLFVGAYERKGLPEALNALSQLENCQFIIIGKPENFSTITVPHSIKPFFISFTKEVHLFYELADLFIFPTKYEPFGLVIIEAYIMGMDLVIPSLYAGASEIIPESEGIYFINQYENFKLPPIKKIQPLLKNQRREERIKNIADFSWKNAGQKFYSILSKY